MSRRLAEPSHAHLSLARVRGYVLLADLPLVLPTFVGVFGDSLLQVIDARTPFIHLVDRRTGSVLQSFGRHGRGPGEFQSVKALANGQHSSVHFWAFEVERRQFTRLTVRGRAIIADTAFSLVKGAEPISPVLVDDSTLLALNTTDAGGIVRINLRTGDVAISGRQRSYEMNGKAVSPFAARQAHTNTRGCFDRGRNALVRIHRYESAIEVLDLSGEARDSVHVPFHFRTRFVPEPDHGQLPEWGGDQRTGYQGCATTDSFIIALFAGHRMGSTESPVDAYNASYLHVFAWDGTFVKAIQLDEPIVAMALHRQTQTMYGVRFRPEPVLVSFDLSAALK